MLPNCDGIWKSVKPFFQAIYKIYFRNVHHAARHWITFFYKNITNDMARNSLMQMTWRGGRRCAEGLQLNCITRDHLSYLITDGLSPYKPLLAVIQQKQCVSVQNPQDT